MASISRERLERAVVRLESISDDEGAEFTNFYNHHTKAEIVAEFPSVFREPGVEQTDSRTNGILYGLLEHYGVRTKQSSPYQPSPQASPSPPVHPPELVTPQTMMEAFAGGKYVSPEEALESLAHALMPFIREVFLEEQITALNIVRQARGAGRSDWG